MTLQGRRSTGKKDPGYVSFNQADKSCNPLLRVISGRGEYELCKKRCFSCIEENEDAFLPRVKDVCLVTTYLYC